MSEFFRAWCKLHVVITECRKEESGYSRRGCDLSMQKGKNGVQQDNTKLSGLVLIMKEERHHGFVD
jgi:hypothetical protein